MGVHLIATLTCPAGVAIWLIWERERELRRAAAADAVQLPWPPATAVIATGAQDFHESQAHALTTWAFLGHVISPALVHMETSPPESRNSLFVAWPTACILVAPQLRISPPSRSTPTVAGGARVWPWSGRPQRRSAEAGCRGIRLRRPSWAQPSDQVRRPAGQWFRLQPRRRAAGASIAGGVGEGDRVDVCDAEPCYLWLSSWTESL